MWLTGRSRVFPFAGVEEYQPCREGHAWSALPAAKQCEDRYALPQAARVPAEDGIHLAPVQAPPQLRRQFQPCRSRRGCAGPAQDRVRIVELRLNVGTEVDGAPDAVAAAGDR